MQRPWPRSRRRGVVTNITMPDPGTGYTSGTTVDVAPPPINAVAPTVAAMVQINSTGLARYDNYQLQFTADPSQAWANWPGGLFTPTNTANSQVFFFTNTMGFFRMEHLP